MNLISSNLSLYTAYADSDFFGKCIFLALFTLSICCWVVVIQKTLQVKKARRLANTFRKACQKNQEHLLALDTKRASHPFAQVFSALKQKALEILNKNHFFSEKKDKVYLTTSDLDLLESHVLTTISSESKALERHLFILSTIRTLAPFLGLLGTVWGILLTFAEMKMGTNVSSNTAILGGLSTALATTVIGLLIAIPALISYNWLYNSSKNLASDMEDFLYSLLSIIELQYRRPAE
jgi:biopolymer transport protein TolQ